MLISNAEWNLVSDSNYLMAVFGSKNIRFNYTVVNKNTIAIRNIYKDGSFLSVFIHSNKMVLIIP